MASFENLITSAVDEGAIMGVVLRARDKSGKLDFSFAAGSSSIEPGSEAPMREDTVFIYASMTKLWVTVAALQLVEKGLIGLDDDVAPLVPELAALPVLVGFSASGEPQTQPRTGTLTLRRLLTHSSGISYAFLDPDVQKHAKFHGLKVLGPGTPGTVAQRFSSPLVFQPGEGWTYGASMDWAGKVIEAVAGQELEAYLQEHVFAPIGVKDVAFAVGKRPDLAARLASLSKRDKGTGRVTHASLGPAPAPAPGVVPDALGGEGAVGTADDFAKLLYSLLMDDGKLLKPETAALMFRPQMEPAAKKTLLTKLEHPEWVVGYVPNTREYDWGFGGLLVDGDSHEYRRKGFLLWSGGFHLNWFLDREAGVFGIFASQLLPGGPTADEPTQALIRAFEREVYARAGKLGDKNEQKL